VAQVPEDRTTVEYVGEGRQQESLDAFWEPCISELLAGLIPEKVLISVFVDDTEP
jgi:hypothetical protein